jgi:hypothetical protein
MKGELGRNLRDTDAATSHDSLEDADDVCLDTHGATLNNGCRFTESAFKQIASHVCPGLSTFISDYSGTVASEHNQRGVQVDGVKAVTTWNELIRRRFHRFQAYRLVRNNSEKLIEGIISRKYSYLDNYALFNEACAALEANQRGVDFYGGLVIGRRVILWFRAETPMFTIEVDGKTWPFYHGYYFTNGEATGNAVQGTIAVFTPAGICLGGFKEYGGKLKHSGKNFHLRLGQMFTKVSQVEFPIESLQTGATALGKQSLGFEPLWEKAEQEERIKEIVTRLQMVGVAQRDGRDILQAALSHGRKGEGAGELVMETSRKYAGRKLIDLFVTMLTVARKIDLKKREKLEQAAFQLLMGTTQI